MSYANTRDNRGPAGEGGGQSTLGAAMVSALGDRDLTIPKICGNPTHIPLKRDTFGKLAQEYGSLWWGRNSENVSSTAIPYALECVCVYDIL